MIRMGRYGFVCALAVLVTLNFLAIPVCADDDDDDKHRKRRAAYELICDYGEPKLLNLKTGKIRKIAGSVDRALAEAICELNAFNEACNPDKTVCDGVCTDVNTDPDNCGDCGIECELNESCVSGECIFECPPGTTDCGGGVCADLTSDPENCGACNRSCLSGETCKTGVCELDCPSGERPCFGECKDLMSDPANCGGCGNACDTNEICVSGICRVN